MDGKLCYEECYKIIKRGEIVDFKNIFHKNKEQYLRDLFTYLSFESISSESQYKEQMDKCALWVKEQIDSMGLETTIFKTKGHDVVFGQKITDNSRPTVLIYGHYDVQPVSPIDQWKSPPFKPEIRNSRIYARGAEDNKGQSFYSLMAVKSFLEAYASPKINIKILIEGEEEIGSPSLKECLIENKQLVQADMIWVVDMGMSSMKEPCITIGARGLYAFDLTLRSMKTDAHSGEFGGIVYNPNRAMAELIARTFDDDGAITIKGFYDDVKPLNREQKQSLDLAFDFEDYRDNLGVFAFHREDGLSPCEANFLRPTFEVNGIWGGYIDEGFKTVIPAESHAKISCRLVPNQDPEKIAKLLHDHIKRNLPEGIDFSMTAHGDGKAYWTSPSADEANILRQAMKDVTGKESKFIFSGGSIPIAYDMAKICGAMCLFPGTALTLDNIHAPNESFGLDQFELGFCLIARALEIVHEKA